MKDLFYTSLLAQARYVSSKIQSETNRNHYIEGYESILEIIEDREDLYSIYVDLLTLDLDLEEVKFGFFSDGKKYRQMVLNHAQDIAKSLRMRFETGGSSEYFVWRSEL